MGGYDAVVVRNSGPVLGYQQAYDEFRARAWNAAAACTTRSPARRTW